MLKRLKPAVVAGSMVAVAACSIFEDPTPEAITFRMNGPAGEIVEVVYSQQFIAGVNEIGVTQVSVFGADTVLQTLPIDTTVSIVAEHQLLLLVKPISADTLDVAVTVDVDTRNLVDNSGKIFSASPWRYVYQFNKRLTQVIEIVI